MNPSPLDSYSSWKHKKTAGDFYSLSGIDSVLHCSYIGKSVPRPSACFQNSDPGNTVKFSCQRAGWFFFFIFIGDFKDRRKKCHGCSAAADHALAAPLMLPHRSGLYLCNCTGRGNAQEMHVCLYSFVFHQPSSENISEGHRDLTWGKWDICTWVSSRQHH